MVATFFWILFQVLFMLILARVILSWLPMFGVRISPYNPIVNFIFQATEPILGAIRRLIPPIGGTIDLSPLIAIILLEILAAIIFGSG